MTEKVNWIDKMIEREALPPTLREETVEVFCNTYNIGTSTYYYQASKPENQEKIVNLSVNYAKKHTSEILDNLGERAKKDNKASELFLEFILKFAKRQEMDLKDISEYEKMTDEELEKALDESKIKKTQGGETKED